MIRHQGATARPTKREYQLFQLLLAHPRRFFTTEQMPQPRLGQARLLPEHFPNYVRRIRKILAELDIPCDLVNRSGCGYSLVFRNEAPFDAPSTAFHNQAAAESGPSFAATWCRVPCST
jgi:DNA-binding response OmpR family regulator